MCINCYHLILIVFIFYFVHYPNYTFGLYLHVACALIDTREYKMDLKGIPKTHICIFDYLKLSTSIPL